LANAQHEIFLIEGHTDFPGNDEVNERTSLMRAKAVFDFLTLVGSVPRNNLVYHGFGRSQLVIKTEKSEIANRRVEIRRITPLVLVRKKSKTELIYSPLIDKGMEHFEILKILQ
jgi:outer membrane protein OmpA-like peptidoglycan-associated protein